MKERKPNKLEMDLPKNDHDISMELFCSKHKPDVEMFMDKMKDENNPYAYGINFSLKEKHVFEKPNGAKKTVKYYIVVVTIKDSEELVENANNRLDCMVRLVNYLTEKIIMT
jgi:hypothetical protein